MKNLFFFTLLVCVLGNCISAPDYKRDNINDRNAGIPYIHDSSYKLNGSGVIVNWTDGSIQNDAYIIEQRMFDHSSNTSDSLIKITELDPEQTFFIDTSKELGYPYTIYIKSRILDGEILQAEVIDTINVEFGRLDYRSQYTTNDHLFFNWHAYPVYHYSDSVLVEKFVNNDWELIDKLGFRVQSYAVEKTSLTGNDRFRISSTVLNFNGMYSRTSSFEVSAQ